ncbi:hypothetical protein [Corynebacterium occultum]|nr:hypothetical protein [Corynebacterium occultum]
MADTSADSDHVEGEHATPGGDSRSSSRPAHPPASPRNTRTPPSAPKLHKPRGRRWWPTRVLILLAFVIPLFTEGGYDPRDTSRVISTTLQDPLIHQWEILRPLATGLLAGMVVMTFLSAFSGRSRGVREKRAVARVLLFAYIFFILVTGFLQNMGQTEEWGFVWVVGNTVVMVLVSFALLPDVRHRLSIIRRRDFRPAMSWTLLPGLFAFIAPYSLSGDIILPPGVGERLVLGDSGITYCFLTPVFLSLLLCFHPGIHSGTLSVISFAGLGFGLFNMLTWFLLNPESWWMGVLHLPLLILSLSGLVIARWSIDRAPELPARNFSPPIMKA